MEQHEKDKFRLQQVEAAQARAKLDRTSALRAVVPLTVDGNIHPAKKVLIIMALSQVAFADDPKEFEENLAAWKSIRTQLDKDDWFRETLFGQEAKPLPYMLAQMNLPVTFNATDVGYGLVGFGGAALVGAWNDTSRDGQVIQRWTEDKADGLFPHFKTVYPPTKWERLGAAVRPYCLPFFVLWFTHLLIDRFRLARY